MLVYYAYSADPATIHVPADSKMVGQNENAHLECAIDANPLDDSMVQWKYGGAEITRPIQRKFQDKKAYLTILNANISDAGSYACYVNNGIGQPVNKTIFLIVKRKFYHHFLLFKIENIRHAIFKGV